MASSENRNGGWWRSTSLKIQAQAGVVKFTAPCGDVRRMRVKALRRVIARMTAAADAAELLAALHPEAEEARTAELLRAMVEERAV